MGAAPMVAPLACVFVAGLLQALHRLVLLDASGMALPAGFGLLVQAEMRPVGHDRAGGDVG
ncbi:MAG TPA: hypothetical protein VMM78_19050 [Thermomicrobiales bacterium]|nr:hypothetical protein [Thermomicrobiales bacterium]